MYKIPMTPPKARKRKRKQRFLENLPKWEPKESTARTRAARALHIVVAGREKSICKAFEKEEELELELRELHHLILTLGFSRTVALGRDGDNLILQRI